MYHSSQFVVIIVAKLDVIKTQNREVVTRLRQSHGKPHLQYSSLVVLRLEVWVLAKAKVDRSIVRCEAHQIEFMPNACARGRAGGSVLLYDAMQQLMKQNLHTIAVREAYFLVVALL